MQNRGKVPFCTLFIHRRKGYGWKENPVRRVRKNHTGAPLFLVFRIDDVTPVEVTVLQTLNQDLSCGDIAGERHVVCIA